MPTKKPKVQGYLDELINERFVQWKQERLIEGNTEALNQILAEYFGLGTSSELIIRQKEAAEEFIPKLREELKQEILSEVNHQLEAIKLMLSHLDDGYRELLNQRESLKESPGDIPGDTPFTDKESITIKELAEQGLEAIERDDKQIDEELEKLLEGIPELSIEHCAARLIQILEAQFGALSKEELKEYPEEDLMNIIFAQNAGINIEQAEVVYQRVLAEIPANRPLSKILGDDEESVELNLEGDSPEESLKESPLEELSHSELVQRLKTNKNTLRSKRNQPGFASWAQQRDNRGLIWHWDGEKKIYQGFRPKPV